MAREEKKNSIQIWKPSILLLLMAVIAAFAVANESIMSILVIIILSEILIYYMYLKKEHLITFNESDRIYKGILYKMPSYKKNKGRAYSGLGFILNMGIMFLILYCEDESNFLYDINPYEVGVLFAMFIISFIVFLKDWLPIPVQKKTVDEMFDIFDKELNITNADDKTKVAVLKDFRRDIGGNRNNYVEHSLTIGKISIAVLFGSFYFMNNTLQMNHYVVTFVFFTCVGGGLVYYELRKVRVQVLDSLDLYIQRLED